MPEVNVARKGGFALPGVTRHRVLKQLYEEYTGQMIWFLFSRHRAAISIVAHIGPLERSRKWLLRALIGAPRTSTLLRYCH